MSTPTVTPATTPTPGTSKLPKLAKLVEGLTENVANRKTFNESGFKDVTKDPELSGDDLAAFLSFNKGTVACQVVSHLPSNPQQFVNVAQEYADWIAKVGRFYWSEAEESEYPNLCPDPGGDTDYGYAKCQMRDPKDVKSTSVGGDLYKVELLVEGEGFLPGCRVEIYTVDPATPDHPGNVVASQLGALDACSTFRYGRIPVTATLPKGKYRTQVVNLFKGGTDFTIGKPDEASFDVP